MTSCWTQVTPLPLGRTGWSFYAPGYEPQAAKCGSTRSMLQSTALVAKVVLISVPIFLQLGLPVNPQSRLDGAVSCCVLCAGLTAEVITPQLRQQLGKLPTKGKVAGLGAGGATGGDLVSSCRPGHLCPR